jgi:hypothetical protein
VTGRSNQTQDLLARRRPTLREKEPRAGRRDVTDHNAEPAHNHASTAAGPCAEPALGPKRTVVPIGRTSRPIAGDNRCVRSVRGGPADRHLWAFAEIAAGNEPVALG